MFRILVLLVSDHNIAGQIESTLNCENSIIGSTTSSKKATFTFNFPDYVCSQNLFKLTALLMRF